MLEDVLQILLRDRKPETRLLLPFDLIQTQHCGRSLVANKFIEKNSVIFEERPLVVGASTSNKSCVCIKCCQTLTPISMTGKQ